MHFGLAVEELIVPTLLLRFNPHAVGGQELPALVDRVKEVAQFIRDVLKDFEAKGNIGAPPVVTVQYFFYGKGSEHRELADHARASLIINDDINVCRAHEMYDDDIASFTFADLDEGAIEQQKGKKCNEMVRAILQADSSAPQCKALTDKRSRCVCNCMVGFDLCNRHFNTEKKGKVAVVRCEDCAEDN